MDRPEFRASTIFFVLTAHILAPGLSAQIDIPGVCHGFKASIINEDKLRAVAVGPRTILTAAHNVMPERTFIIKRNKKNIHACCDVPLGYPMDPNQKTSDLPDLALCRVNDDHEDLAAPLKKDRPYESINLEPRLVAHLDTVRLNGQGRCFEKTEVYSSGLQPEWTLRVKAQIVRGDSGSPAFDTRTPDKRIIIGVNRYIDCDQIRSTCSLLASTSAVKDWIEAWARGDEERKGSCPTARETKVCGVNGVNASNQPGCRKLSPSTASQDEATEVDSQPRR